MRVLMIDEAPWRIEVMHQIFKYDFEDVNFESLVVGDFTNMMTIRLKVVETDPDIIIWNDKMFTGDKERKVILFSSLDTLDTEEIIENLKKIFDLTN